jgi:hypothetical protein
VSCEDRLSFTVICLILSFGMNSRDFSLSRPRTARPFRQDRTQHLRATGVSSPVPNQLYPAFERSPALWPFPLFMIVRFFFLHSDVSFQVLCCGPPAGKANPESPLAAFPLDCSSIDAYISKIARKSLHLVIDVTNNRKHLPKQHGQGGSHCLICTIIRFSLSAAVWQD